MFLFHPKKVVLVGIVGFCIVGEKNKSFFWVFSKNFLDFLYAFYISLFWLWKKKFKKSFWKTLNQPKNPTRWIFFGEKAILEESNKPSLGNIRWGAHSYTRITHSVLWLISSTYILDRLANSFTVCFYLTFQLENSNFEFRCR